MYNQLVYHLDIFLLVCVMFKRLFQIVLVILIGFQTLTYFSIKRVVPNWVDEQLESIGCSQYENMGMDLPFSVLFNTKTIGTVYLFSEEVSKNVELEVEIVDTNVPLMKGIGEYLTTIRNKDLRSKLSHCYIKKST